MQKLRERMGKVNSICELQEANKVNLHNRNIKRLKSKCARGEKSKSFPLLNSESFTSQYSESILVTFDCLILLAIPKKEVTWYLVQIQ